MSYSDDPREYPLFNVDERDSPDPETDDWYNGFQAGYVRGFDDGVMIGRDQGYADCLYRVKKMAEDSLDPDLERAIKILTGED